MFLMYLGVSLLILPPQLRSEIIFFNQSSIILFEAIR